jgi:uncharacterized protein YndB with AHSA1/START domain
MPQIVCSVDIERPPGDVFDYVTDPSRFGEWQKDVVSGHTEGAEGVGGRCVMTRKVGGRRRTSNSEITAYEPPARWAIHGVDGPIRADVFVWVEPVDAGQAAEGPGSGSESGAGSGSRVTISLDFHGHGVGKLLAPLVTSQARKEVPVSCQNLKERLEQGG